MGVNVIPDSGFNSGQANYDFNPYSSNVTLNNDNEGTSGSSNVNVLFPAYGNENSTEYALVQARISTKTEVPVVKGKVYILSLDIRTTPSPGPADCSVTLLTEAGTFFGATAFSSIISVFPASYSRIAGALVAPANPLTAVISLACIMTSMPQTIFYVDNFELKAVDP